MDVGNDSLLGGHRRLRPPLDVLVERLRRPIGPPEPQLDGVVGEVKFCDRMS